MKTSSFESRIEKLLVDFHKSVMNLHEWRDSEKLDIQDGVSQNGAAWR
jgi:hypothetical protein